MKRLVSLKQQADATMAAMSAINAEADKNTDAPGVLSADQEARYAPLRSKLANLKNSIEDAKALEDAEKVSAAIAVDDLSRVRVGEDRATQKPWANMGEQLLAIVQAGTPGGIVDQRLYAAASGASTQVGSEAGFAIQKDFIADLTKDAFESGALSSRCASHEVTESADGLEVVYVEETSRATGSRWGGVQIYRRAEADTVTAKKPKLGKWEVRLEDLMGLAYLTGRVQQDAGQMLAVFNQAFSEEFPFTLDDEILRGTGVGQCQGILNAAATVSVTRNTSNRIMFEDVVAMWKRVPPRSKARGAWFVNSETISDMIQLQVATGTSGQLVYLPPTGITGNVYGSLFGRPVIEIEHASALGTVGDIAFLDLTQYQLVRKGGVQADSSMHVRFLYDEMALRWIVRVNGAPKIKSALTPYKGSSTYSPFVTLAT